MSSLITKLGWAAVAMTGAAAFAVIALQRGESIGAIWIVIATICVYTIAYRFYSQFVARRVLRLDPTRMTPAYKFNDGLDYVPTNKYVLFGHHFAAIAGAGPLVGPILAAQMGYMPGMLWLLAGVVFAGAVQDFTVLFISTRRNGRSLGDLIKSELGQIPGMIALFGTFFIMLILLAVLALIVVKALAESPWGTFTVAATIPIALFMGVYARYFRPGAIGEVSLLGFVLLMLSIVGGQYVQEVPELSALFTLTGEQLTWLLIGYGFIASVLPIWLLLAPRDYLSTFLKIGTIVGLAIGVIFISPELKMPAFTQFVDGSGPVWSGSLFPFLFITIACGAVSGFHSLISSGTTPKMIRNETDARFIGYGAMLMESFVAIMALVAASTLEPGVYFAMNSPAAIIGTTAESAAQTISQWGFYLTPEMVTQTAKDVGETHHHFAHWRCADLGGGHGAYPVRIRRGPGDDGLLVSLRHPVRSAFHPHCGGCWHPCRTLHAAGFAGQLHPIHETHRLPGREPDRHWTLRRRLGLFSLPGGRRSPGRNQYTVAIVWNF